MAGSTLPVSWVPLIPPAAPPPERVAALRVGVVADEGSPVERWRVDGRGNALLAFEVVDDGGDGTGDVTGCGTQRGERRDRHTGRDGRPVRAKRTVRRTIRGSRHLVFGACLGKLGIPFCAKTTTVSEPNNGPIPDAT